MEILGSGDATNPALQFQLKQSPLTYTAAATAGGSQSTLQVRVNNLLWTEVPFFLSSAPSDRAYVTRPNWGAGATVQFGDGIQGSRTPTGVSNIQRNIERALASPAWSRPASSRSLWIDHRVCNMSPIRVRPPAAPTRRARPAAPVRAAAHAHARPHCFAGGLSKLRPRLRGNLARAGDMDLVREHAGRLPDHRGRRGNDPESHG